MSPCDRALNEVFPLEKGSAGVVRSSFPNPLRQLPEGFDFFPLLLRGTR
jgi:hypothetical protein